MERRKERRYRLSSAQCNTLWARWKTGATMSEIAEGLNTSLSSVAGMVYRHGGIPPRVRRRAERTLSLAEREEISRGLAAGLSFRAIARGLGRAPSTVSREIHRHEWRRTAEQRGYRATVADGAAWALARRPKRCRLASQGRLRRVVATRLARGWSPQQIAGWLMRTYPLDPTMHVSHETIYRTLYIQARGALKKELLVHLRRGRTVRRSQLARPRRGIADAVSIAERPAEVEDRAIPGHWEGDLLAGTKNSHIATLVERHSRYVHLVKVGGKDAESVTMGLLREVQRLPRGLRASLTWDRGSEMAHHQLFSVISDVKVFFCDPHSPWQRGSNENTNGLLRQYLPKGTDLRPLTQRQLDSIAKKLNTRPRQTLDFQTPAEVLAAAVASTR
jgi:IS30 family transposase